MRKSISEIKEIIREGEEAEALDFIFSNCFKSGFGILGKSEIDLILFATILKYAKQENTSDHALSMFLQITQRRVRNLKESASVKYFTKSREEAIEYFVEKTKDAKTDDKYIDIPIKDVAVKNEIEAILDERNILLHSQLNPKIFRIRIDDFFELTIQLELELNKDETERSIEKRIIELLKADSKRSKELSKKLDNSKGESIATLTKSSLKSALVKGSLSFGIDLLASFIPGGVFLTEPTKNLLMSLKDKV